MPSISGFATSSYDDSTIGVNVSNQLEVKDNGVGLAKLTHGTADTLIGFDGSGIPTEIAKAAAGGWVIVSESTVTGSDVQEVEITGLDLNTDEVYRLFIRVEQNAGAVCSYRLQLNGDTNDANYIQSITRNTGGTITGTSVGNAIVNEVTNVAGLKDSCIDFVIMARPSTGAEAHYACRWITATPTLYYVQGNLSYTDTTNITSLKFRASVASGIKIGSYFLLTKLRG